MRTYDAHALRAVENTSLQVVHCSYDGESLIPFSIMRAPTPTHAAIVASASMVAPRVGRQALPLPHSASSPAPATPAALPALWSPPPYRSPVSPHHLLSASYDGTLKVWDVRTTVSSPANSLTHSLSHSHTHSVARSLAHSPSNHAPVQLH